MKTLSPLQNYIFRLGAVLMVIGAALFIITPLGAFVAMAIGVAMFSSMQLLQRYDGNNLIVMRLRSQQMLGVICMLGAVIVLSMQVFRWGWFRHNEWPVLLLIGAIVQLYTAIRIPHELKKENTQL